MNDDPLQKQIAFLRREKVYDDEGRSAWHILENAATDIERLIRDRDESLTEAKEAKELMQTHASEIFGAEARGYRRGVEDAAGVMDEYDLHRCSAAILALLEQTGDANAMRKK